MLEKFFRNPLVKGFTLIEILVVISIIGIIATTVFALLNEGSDDARIKSVQAQLHSIHTAMELLYNDTGLYPHKKNKYCPPVNAALNEVDLSLNTSGLIATDGTYPNWNGPYIPGINDPWGNPYYFDEDYQCTAGAVGCGGILDSGTDSSVLVSCGPNKALSGNGCAYDDDNVVYVFCRK